jgi:exodeoxyribonuclease V alpha subunit
MEETLKGYIDRITFHNPDNGYTVARLKVEGEREAVTLIGDMPFLGEGEHVEVSGAWETHAEFGRQLRVSAHTRAYPSTLEGIRRYLGSGLIKGIGRRTAERIVEKFGAATLEVLDEEPLRLLEVPKLGRKSIERITAAWAEQRQVKDVMVFLQSHGVSTGYAVRIFKEYGQEVIQRVSQNPYRLERDIDGIGFRMADQIARELGIARDSLPRIQAGVRYLLEQAAKDGHVFLPLVDLIERGRELLEINAELMPPALSSLRLEDGLVTEETRYYLPPLYHAEQGVCSSLQRLSRALSPPLALPPPAEDGLELAPEQEEAVSLVAAQKVLVLTGGPGTGKTTVTRRILDVFSHNKLSVALCSPTGRAAKRLSEATGLPASTIHRLLEYQPAEGGFQKNYDDKLDVEALIVDEASMIDVVLMNALLRALPANTRLVLVGDVDQLPSVGPGNVLRDIIDAGQVPVVRLERIFRQGEGSLIIENAHRINRGEEVGRDNKRDGDFFFVEEADAAQAAARVVELVASRLPSHGEWDAKRDIQVITPMYRGETGAHNLNRLLQHKLNPSGLGHRKGEVEIRVGDKVMQVRNNYDKGVFNGDMGIVRRIDPESQKLIVQFDQWVEYEFSQFDELALAYAISTHRSQGSEFKVVVMPVGMQHYIMLQRNLIYTAVTRAKEMLVMVGTRRALKRAVENDGVAQRNTTLAPRLRGETGQKLADAGEDETKDIQP